MADRPFESGQQVQHVDGCPGCIWGTAKHGHTDPATHLPGCPFDPEVARMADEGCPN